MNERAQIEETKRKLLETLERIRGSSPLWPTLVGLLEQAGFPREARLDRGRSHLTTKTRIQKLPHHLTIALQELLEEEKIVIKLGSFFELAES